ncbi:cob(I)yrinic acid a,c-diamide adenosyltransferase [Alteromonas lipolytica]|uniref:Corrinoid adenosyltransferase n=1 Tax=Alteromonas lipolytica TaxID=1856405 RepID=A0A1E8FKG0_9ALTE|nr:cob(I)yrinic acid a,c-diamide adenosyltransferase [Alteromonas lipolytica]OFI36420.1 ATP:cob(I)alamin adenosyltransferase [Alteromonas lipolytica]GGF70044.1 ATP--cob(I)alamin adenosyltransferase [Alteromonas lipolytica]
MKIYTKTGDQGETQLYVNQPLKVRKDDAHIECYGSLDELNAQIGLLIARLQEDNLATNDDISTLTGIQNALFSVGFAVSASSSLSAHAVIGLESHIDVMQADLPPQTSFILPGGCVAAAQAHVCRTVCRRAERRMITLAKFTEVSEHAQQYVNRLSDWLYVFARYLNARASTPDVPVTR